MSVEEIDTLRALRRSYRTADDGAQPAASETVALEGDLTDEMPEFEPFREAGWQLAVADHLRGPDEAGLLGVVAGPQSLEPEEVHRIYRDRDGRLMLGANRLTIRLADSLSADEAEAWLNEHGFRVLDRLVFAPNLIQVAVPSGLHEVELAAALADEGVVVYAEPEFVERLSNRSSTQTRITGAQWQWGPSIDGGVAAEDAWKGTRGRGSVIGVIDRGFALAHEGLRPAIRSAVAFVESRGRSPSLLPASQLPRFPVNVHGTCCAGMAAARPGAQPASGIAPEAALSLVACLADRTGSQVTLARAVAYLADPSTEGVADGAADVIVCSLGPDGGHWELAAVLEDAITFATTLGRSGRGALVVWATSNGHQPVADDEVCSRADVFGVGRATAGNMSGRSSYGPGLDLLAPGVDLWGISLEPGLAKWTGTSYAAPIIAGIAALLLSVAPDLSPSDLRNVLTETADKVGPDPYGSDGWNATCGHGRANAGRAVAAVMALA